MRWNSFLGSLIFGLLAAALYQPALLFAGPAIGFRAAAALYVTLVAATYAAGLVADPRRGLGGALLVGTISTVTALVTSSPPMVAVAALVAVALVRSALYYEQPFGRALFVELALLFGSTVLGAYLTRQGALGGALAIWGVFLVQSLYFLLVAASPTARERPKVIRDPFDAARSRAYALLDG